MIITKPAGTVAALIVHRNRTLLYEIHDPSAYLAPDVVLDVTDVMVDQLATDRVRVTGARGKPAPETLKATVCVDGGVLGEAEISYAGPNAAARARLAGEIISARMRKRAPGLVFRIDAIGVVSVLGENGGTLSRPWVPICPMYGCGLQLSRQNADVELLLDEVEALYCAGPAGGSGVRRRLTPRLASASCLIERKFAAPRVTVLGDSA